jgi:O-antigen/teichoic acid export membrane protein
MVAGLLTARVAGPSVLGLFSSLSLFQSYIPFLQLGVLNGLNRELPYHFGKGEHERAREFAAVAQAWALLVGSIVAAAALGVAAFHLLRGRGDLAAGWATNALSAWFLFYCTFYLQMTYRTHGDFARLALVNVIQAVAAFLLVVLVWWLNFYGLCLRAALIGLVQLVLLYHWRPVKVGPRWNGTRFVHLLKTGAPIYAVGQLYAWWGVLDVTLILYFMGTRVVGLYSLVTMATGALVFLPDALSQVLYPRLAQEYGRSGSVRELVRQVRRPIILSFSGIMPIIVASWFFLPPIVRVLLPKYAEAIPAAQWSLLIPAAMCLTPGYNIFNVVKRQDLFALAIVAGTVTSFCVLMWLLRDGLVLTAFPQAMLVGRLVFLGAITGGLAYLCRLEKIKTRNPVSRCRSADNNTQEERRP